MYLVFYTNLFVPKISAGCTRGPFIFIRPRYKDDKGLLEHEKVHVRQWFRTLGLHGFIYALSKRYRLKCEVEAYKEQLKHYPEDKTVLFAGYIAMFYGLHLSESSVVELLKSRA